MDVAKLRDSSSATNISLPGVYESSKSYRWSFSRNLWILGGNHLVVWRIWLPMLYDQFQHWMTGRRDTDRVYCMQTLLLAFPSLSGHTWTRLQSLLWKHRPPDATHCCHGDSARRFGDASGELPLPNLTSTHRTTLGWASSGRKIVALGLPWGNSWDRAMIALAHVPNTTDFSSRVVCEVVLPWWTGLV